MLTEKTEKEVKELLNQMKIAHWQKEYPNFPLSAMPKPNYQCNSTNGLTACIVDFIRFNGGYVARTNTTGIMRAGKWTKGGGTKGAADLNCVINGQSVQVEIKFGKDTIRPAQVKQMEKVRAAGGIFYVATDLASFYQWYVSNFQTVV